jgi:chromosome condensin MukBEF MukE localization factor
VKRMLWFSLGIAAGVAASRRARDAARRMTPAGVAENLGDAVRELAAAMGSFGAEVRAGMVQREAELRATVAQRTGMDLAPRQASTRARATSARA